MTRWGTVPQANRWKQAAAALVSVMAMVLLVVLLRGCVDDERQVRKAKLAYMLSVVDGCLRPAGLQRHGEPLADPRTRTLVLMTHADAGGVQYVSLSGTSLDDCRVVLLGESAFTAAAERGTALLNFRHISVKGVD